jgi:hypothetical protein
MIWMWILACGSKEDTGTETTLEEPASFTQIEEELIKVSCAFSSCHGMSAGGLLLDGEDDYARLVNQPSSVLPEEILIVPNDVDASYFFHKLVTGENIDGDIMAPGQGISDYQEALLRSWIDDGAPNN